VRSTVLLVLSVAACAGQQSPGEARTTVLSLTPLDDGDLGESLARRLAARRGVQRARFDKRRAEITVIAAPSVDALAEARVMKDDDYDVALGGGHGSYVPWTKPPSGTDVATLAKDGEDIADLAIHAVPGKVTVFDFFAVWCEPCRELDTHVLGLVLLHKNVAYRKLEIADWDTPLARHYLPHAPTLPYVVVFDASGKKAGTVMGLNLDRLDQLIEAGGAR
jgi:thiol-disulfide isomerase/thioredoxin